MLRLSTKLAPARSGSAHQRGMPRRGRVWLRVDGTGFHASRPTLFNAPTSHERRPRGERCVRARGQSFRHFYITLHHARKHIFLIVLPRYLDLPRFVIVSRSSRQYPLLQDIIDGRPRPNLERRSARGRVYTLGQIASARWSFLWTRREFELSLSQRVDRCLMLSDSFRGHKNPRSSFPSYLYSTIRRIFVLFNPEASV